MKSMFVVFLREFLYINHLTPRSDWCKTSPYKYIYIIQQTGNENIQTYWVEAAILI